MPLTPGILIWRMPPTGNPSFPSSSQLLNFFQYPALSPLPYYSSTHPYPQANHQDTEFPLMAFVQSSQLPSSCLFLTRSLQNYMLLYLLTSLCPSFKISNIDVYKSIIHCRLSFGDFLIFLGYFHCVSTLPNSLPGTTVEPPEPNHRDGFLFHHMR